jgi:hypothetical protein
MENYISTVGLFCRLLAERTGRTPTDLQVRSFAGAVVGALTAVFEVWIVDPDQLPIAQLIDDALSHLKDGLPL